MNPNGALKPSKKLTTEEIREKLAQGLFGLYNQDPRFSIQPQTVYVQSQNLDLGSPHSKIKQILDMKRILHANLLSQTSQESLKNLEPHSQDSTIKQLQIDLSRKEQEKRTFEAQASELKAEIALQEHTFSRLQSTYEEKLSSLMLELKVALEENSLRLVEADRLKRQLKVQEEEFLEIEVHHKQRIIALTEKLDSNKWTEKIKEAQSRISALEKDLAAQTQEFQFKEKESVIKLNEERDHVNRYKELVRRLQTQINEQENLLKAKENPIQSKSPVDANDQIKALKLQLSTVQTENLNLHFINERLNENQRHKETEKSAKQSQEAILSEEITYLRKELAKSKEQTDHYRLQIGNHAENYQKLISENEKVNEKLIKIASKRKTLKSDYQSLLQANDEKIKTLIAYRLMVKAIIQHIEEITISITGEESVIPRFPDVPDDSATFFTEQTTRFFEMINEIENFYKEQIQQLKTDNQELAVMVDPKHSDYSLKDFANLRHLANPQASDPQSNYKLRIQSDKLEEISMGNRQEEPEEQFAPNIIKVTGVHKQKNLRNLGEKNQENAEMVEEPLDIPDQFANDDSKNIKEIIYEEINIQSNLQSDNNENEMNSRGSEALTDDKRGLKRELEHKIQQIDNLKEINKSLQDRLSALNSDFFEEKGKNLEQYQELSAEEFRLEVIQNALEEIWNSLDEETEVDIIKEKTLNLNVAVLTFFEFLEFKLKEAHFMRIETQKMADLLKETEEEREEAFLHLRKEREQLEKLNEKIEEHSLQHKAKMSKHKEKKKAMKLKYEDKLHLAKKEAEKEHSALFKELEATRDKLQTLIAQNESLSGRLGQKNAEIAGLQIFIKDLEEKSRAKLTTANSQKIESGENINELKISISELKQKLEDQQQSVKKLQSEKEASAEKLKSSELGYEHLLEKYKKMQKYNKDLKEDNALDRENKELRLQIKTLENLRIENDEIKSQIENYKSKYLTQKQANSQLENDKKAISGLKESQISELAHLKKLLEAKNREIDELISREAELSRKILDLSKLAESKDQDLKSKEQLIKEKKKEIKKFKHSIQLKDKSIQNLIQGSQQHQSETVSIDLPESDPKSRFKDSHSPKNLEKNIPPDDNPMLYNSLPVPSQFNNNNKDFEIFMNKGPIGEYQAEGGEQGDHTSIYSQPKKRKNKKKKKTPNK